MESYNEWKQKDKFQNPDAGGKDAQPEVQKAVKRFRKLPAKKREKTPLLYWLLGSGTQPYKTSREDSQYTDKTHRTQQCKNCVHAFENVTSGKWICSQIQEEIKSSGWCNLWEEGDYNPRKDR
jgi:hypothetical protein